MKQTRNRAWASGLKPALALAATACLSACVSIGGGGEMPDRLLTLTPAASAPAGASQSGQALAALAVLTPSAPQSLNVPRVPVHMGDSTLAYLKDAVWVEKPADLFRRLLAETIRAGGRRMVVDGGDLEFSARTQLTGQLAQMGYDAPSSSVIVRYDAVLQMSDGTVRMQRFESSEANVLPDAAFVGPALNRAANDVAAQVAEWVG